MSPEGIKLGSNLLEIIPQFCSKLSRNRNSRPIGQTTRVKSRKQLIFLLLQLVLWKSCLIGVSTQTIKTFKMWGIWDVFTQNHSVHKHRAIWKIDGVLKLPKYVINGWWINMQNFFHTENSQTNNILFHTVYHRETDKKK